MPSGSPSTALNGRSDLTGAPLLNQAAMLLLGRLPESDSDFDALGARLGKVVGRKHYSGYYIEQIMIGRHKFREPVQQATFALIGELLAEPPKPEYRYVTVRVPEGIHVPENTIILTDANTCICGESFIPRIWNQVNHTRACAVLRRRLSTSTE